LLNIALCVLILTVSQTARADVVTAPDSLIARYYTYTAWYSPEKVYLHFDRSCYTAGETVWFKGWVQEASRHSALPPSNFIYAEVLDDHGEAVTRVKIKRDGEGFPGCIELPDYLETGNYTIRAYTLWQLNNGNDYLFNDAIRIIGGGGKKEKPSRPSPDKAKVSFWPESGRYFAGHKAVIGFKAVDRLGRSMDFTGILVSDKEGEVKQVRTGHDGMGVFTFLPKAGHNYSVLDAYGTLHPLPQASEDGGTLQLITLEDRYYINALGFGGGTASLLLRDLSELRPIADIGLDGKARALIVEKSFFHPGINHLLLVDAKGKIMAERLFFVRDAQAAVCRVDINQFPDNPKALVNGTVFLNRTDGTPLDGTCSISVVRGTLKNWHQSDGIVSYMGLSSELKGRINNPYYYFDPDIPEHERDVALDLLMMIQGWRYYDLKTLSGVKFLRERMQEIRGRITRRISSKIPRNFTFTFLVPQQKLLHSIEVEKGRRFIIDSLDFPENTEMIINIGSPRLGAHYIPKWDGDPAAETYLYRPAPGFANSLFTTVPQLNETAPGDTLNAAVVTARYEYDDVLVFGKSYREDLVTFKDMTLLEYLRMTKAAFEYDGENMYNRNRRRDLDSSGDSVDSDDENDSGRVLLIVDDTEEAWWNFDMLRLEDLRSLSISTKADPVYGGDGGVVHISIKPGGIRRETERNPSMLYFVPQGYQVTRYFNSPRYDRGEEGSDDNRNTIWWSPNVILSDGCAEIEFCNSERTDFPYLVRIEGLDADGRPFSCHRLVQPGEHTTTVKYPPK